MIIPITYNVLQYVGIPFIHIILCKKYKNCNII